MRGLGLIAIVLAAAVSHAEPLKFEFLSNRAEVLREYCRTEGVSTTSCTIPTSEEAVKIFVPEIVHAAVVKHLEAAKAARYYDSLSMEDLFHGHLILRGPQLEYASADQFVDDINAILYHSAEYNHRWEREADAGIEVINRRIRSFLGDLHSPRLESAADVVGLENLSSQYEGSGTIYVHQILAARPELSSHEWGSYGGQPKLTINVCKDGQCRPCFASAQLYVLRLPISGVETYFRCEFPSRSGQNSHTIVPRPPQAISSI